MWSFTRRLRAPAASHTDIRAAFKVLGLAYSPYLPPTSMNDQVRKNYRELARLHHPDLSSGDDNRMKVINTAYELIQSSGVLQGVKLDDGDSGDGSGDAGEPGATRETRFSRKAGSRRRRMPDDFASGDDQSSASSGAWSMRSTLDWQSLMNSTETLTKEEMNNPANHPFSHSRFFTFDEDVTVYKMIRGGATVPQVARTMGKPATFIEKRLHNAQFKLRVQYVLRGEKRSGGKAATAGGGGSGGPGSGKPRHGCDQEAGPTPAAPVGPNTHEKLIRRYAHEQDPSPAFTKNHGPRFGHKMQSNKRKEWEATMPEWQEPRYSADMSLEERGRKAGLLRDHDRPADRDPLWGRDAAHLAAAASRSCGGGKPRGAASKMGRSYANYSRLRGDKTASPYKRRPGGR